MGYVRTGVARPRARPRRRALVGFGDDVTSAIPGVFSARAERWRDELAQLAPDIPTSFLVAWLDEESGGNECSLGILTIGKQEAGIWQTMHPQDDKYGATYDQLRSGCNGQTLVDPSAVNHNAQMAGLNMVRDYMQRTDGLLAQNGVAWDRSSSDYWKAVKSIHGLPCVLGDLLPRVIAKTGAPPRTWDDFRDQVMAMDPSEMAGSGCQVFFLSPSHEGNQNRLDDIFANATKAGRWGGGVLGAIPGPVIAATPLLALGAGALLLAYLWKRSKGR